MNDEEKIRELTALYLSKWDIRDQPFDGGAFKEIFAAGEISVFDNVQGDVVVIRDADTYRKTWTPFMQPLVYWAVRMDDLKVEVSGDSAYTTFKLVGTDNRGEDGVQIPFRQYGTHVWRKTDPQDWRIVHEHLTVYDTKSPN